MSLPPELRPTDKSDMTGDDIEYLSYRVTLSLDQHVRIEETLSRYCTEYLIYPHKGDQDIPNPHFHILIPTTDSKLSDRIKVGFSREFARKGNGFHSAKYHSNGLLSGISYCIHDRSGTPTYKGDYWSSLLESATPFVKTERVKPSVKRERLSDYVLTLSNVLKQAAKYRETHSIVSRSLYFIMDTMLKDGWIPSRDILSKGIPEELYEIWDVRTKPNSNNNAKLHFLMPHPRSEKSKEWNGYPAPSLSRFND